MNEMRDTTDDGDMKGTIARILLDAEKAHTEYKASVGQNDNNWHEWYAEYILDHLPEQG